MNIVKLMKKDIKTLDRRKTYLETRTKEQPDYKGRDYDLAEIYALERAITLIEKEKERYETKREVFGK